MYASKTYDTPLLTANGTMGGSSFAVFGGGTATNGDVWNAFDGDPATYYRADNTLANQYIIMYFPIPLFLVDLNIKSLYNSTSHNEWGSIATGEIDGSNDNSTWVKVSDISNSTRGAYTIIVNSTTAYKYYRLNPATFLSDTVLHIAELKIIARYNDEDTSVIGTDKDKITANNLNEVTTYANKVNTIAGSILSVPAGVTVGNISKPTDLSNIQNAINNLENLLSLNCCQQGAGDCCQGCQSSTCQTQTCQSATCQTQTCQSATCQGCQTCQSCQKCQTQCRVATGSGSCFIGDTLVLMSNYIMKKIKDVKIGDKVITATGIGTVTKIHRSILGNKRSIYTFKDKSLYFTGEHQMWIKKDNKEYFGVVDWTQHMREKDELRYPEFKGRTLSIDPMLIDKPVQFATVNGWKLDEPIMDRSFNDDTEVYGLFVDGSHTMIANGYLVAGFPDERDFNYSTLKWNGLFVK